MVALRGENKRYPAYSQLREIPGGGQGQIHVGWHTGYGVAVVQKTYDRPGREDAVVFAEPRLLHALDHRRIVRILDTQPDGDREHAVTIVMPAYSGGDLRLRIERAGALSVGRVIEWTGQVADALDYLHTVKSLVHRDIKPGNVLIDEAGDMVLCDFGTAAFLDADGCTGPVRATVHYQPPETAGLGIMSAKSDVYSLGLTAIEMIDGRFLYDGRDIARVQARVDGGSRGYPASALASSARAPHVPSALRALLARCVDRDPDRRPTAAELARTLACLRVVDWARVDGDGLDGTWEGTWPLRSRPDRATSLRVVSTVRARGASAGRRDLAAFYRRPRSTGWRTVGSDISPVLADAHDDAAVSAFFRTVEDRVAHRFPA